MRKNHLLRRNVIKRLAERGWKWMHLCLFTALISTNLYAQQMPEPTPTAVSQVIDQALQSGTPSGDSLRLGQPSPEIPLRLNAPADAGPVGSEANDLNQSNVLPPSTSESVPGMPSPDFETMEAVPVEESFSEFDSTCDMGGATAVGPKSPRCIRGFHCVGGPCDGPPACPNPWKCAGPIPFEAFAQGDYIGQARSPHLSEYRLRTDDLLEFVFRFTGQATATEYELQTGDVIRIDVRTEGASNEAANPVGVDSVDVQPDGFITLPVLGRVRAAGATMTTLSDELTQRLAVHMDQPSVTVVPIRVNTALEEFRNSVSPAGNCGGGQSRKARVTPAGTIQLPAIGSVHAQGLSLTELQREIDLAYDQVVAGIEVTPILVKRAPRYVYVLGEVARPGRFALSGPTTAMQAMAMAGSYRQKARLSNVVIFRRDDGWNLMATRLDLRAALRGKDPCPAGEVWLRDSDIVLVPSCAINVIDDAMQCLFGCGGSSLCGCCEAECMTTL